MGGRDFQQGDRVVCLTNHRDRTITNGLRGEIVDVDADTGRFILRTPTDRRVTINSKTYDDVDYGYALTVHKAQGMTADVALVVGSDAMHRELAYTGMSRGRQANRYYEIDHAPDRDVLGTGHWPKEEPSVAERVASAWGRSRQKDSTLDYQRCWDGRVNAEFPNPPVESGSADQAAKQQGSHLAALADSWMRPKPGVAAATPDDLDRTLAGLEARLTSLSAKRSGPPSDRFPGSMSDAAAAHPSRAIAGVLNDPLSQQVAETAAAPEGPSRDQ
jgi:hypothetical protein